MSKIFIICFFIALNFLHAQINNAFVNILSNVDDTTIFINGENIGKTPIEQYEVNTSEPLLLEAKVDTNYYIKNIEKTIIINNKTVPTYTLKFEKAKTKIFFVGVDAELYINDKFIKKLDDSNRVVTLEAGKKVKIKLENGEAEAVLYRDIQANKLNTLKYKLTTTPKEIRLYTSTINDLMWEDTKDAANTNINWEKAEVYCKYLEFAHFDDFRLPTIEELDELYKNKEKIYNGFGGKFYWSSSTFRDEYKVWDYSVVKNFEDGMNQKSIKEFAQGRVRCVRDNVMIEEKKEENENE